MEKPWIIIPDPNEESPKFPCQAAVCWRGTEVVVEVIAIERVQATQLVRDWEECVGGEESGAKHVLDDFKDLLGLTTFGV